jgi:hypothetical protein
MTKGRPVFGKRGGQKETVEHKPTVIDRLKKAGSWLWAKKDRHTKKAARSKDFRR